MGKLKHHEDADENSGLISFQDESDDSGAAVEDWGGASLTSQREGQNAHELATVAGPTWRIRVVGWHWLAVSDGMAYTILDESDYARCGWATGSRLCTRLEGFEFSFVAELWRRGLLPP